MNAMLRPGFWEGLGNSVVCSTRPLQMRFPELHIAKLRSRHHS